MAAVTHKTRRDSTQAPGPRRHGRREPGLCGQTTERFVRTAARPCRAPAPARLAFTLLELLVVVSIIALLMSMLLPGMQIVRDRARTARCAANLRQLGVAFHLYACDYSGRAMPLAYFQQWPITYWYGRECDEAGVDPTQGFVWPYLQNDLKDVGILECAAQPIGTFDRLQGTWRSITSTYGYNGYFLAPASTPGWAARIGRRPWQILDTMSQPQNVIVFGDTMIDWNGQLKNCALVDPPMLYQGNGAWTVNPRPTTCFRHSWEANLAFADGHVSVKPPGDGLIQSFEFRLGSVGRDNDPHYVPDWMDW